MAAAAPPSAFASELRLRSVPWRALRGMGPRLELPLAAVLQGSPAERVLDRFLRDHRCFGQEQRRAAAEAIFGVALWRRRLVWHASPSPGPASARATSALERAPLVLLAALVRDLGCVAEAETIAGVVPGALPSPRPPPAELALRFSLPDWLAAILVREAGVEAEALADALNVPGPVCLRPNLLRTTPEALAARLAREGVSTRRGRLVPSALIVTSVRPNIYGLEAHREGLFEVQDEASQLVAGLLGAAAGAAVLDLCAGAGGKTLQLAAAVGEAGAVHATDIDGARLERLRRRAARAGASSIVKIHGGAPPSDLLVDGALVDAPCSELGALRRGPDARFRVDPATFGALPELQLALLGRAAGHVRPGGRLVYATCTLRREEDEDVALAFEQAHPEFTRVPLHDFAAPAHAPGGFVRTWPHRHGCDGFFAASWRRT